MNGEVVISVRGASKKFCADLNRSLRYAVSDGCRDLFVRRKQNNELRPGEFWALRDISFELRRGQALGVMGVNGAGKSTLLKLLIGGVRLTEGRIEAQGRIGALSDMGLGFDPVLSGRENAYMSAAVLGIDRKRIEGAFNDIVAFAELEEFIDSPVQIYSSGMRTRLGFSVAMFLEPDILLVDEVLAVGDIGFQRKCLTRARRYLDDGGSLVLVSHNAHQVQHLCNRCIVLNHGRIAFDGEAIDGVTHYLELSQAGPVLGDETSEIAQANFEESRDPAAGLESATSADLRQVAGNGIGDTFSGKSAADSAATPTATSPKPAQSKNPSLESGVAIEEVGVEPLGPNGIRTNEPVRIYVRYSARTAIEAGWGFCIVTSDLVTKVTCDGFMEGTRLSEGTGELSCTIPMLPLVGRRYALTASILDPDSWLPFALSGLHDAPYYFEVSPLSGRRGNAMRYNDELVVLQNVTFNATVCGGDDRGQTE